MLRRAQHERIPSPISLLFAAHPELVEGCRDPSSAPCYNGHGRCEALPDVPRQSHSLRCADGLGRARSTDVRRRPEDTVLHRVVREHLETFLAEARLRGGGEGLPGRGKKMENRIQETGNRK